MKKIGFMCLLFFLCMVGALYAQEEMKTVYFDNYQPFSWKNDSGIMQGIMIDVLNEAIQTQMGIRISHQGYPWKRAQKMVRDGDADAFVTVPTAERREYAEISTEAVLTVKVTMFTRKGHPKIDEFRKIKTISDLNGFKLLDYIGNGWAKIKLAGFERELCPKMDNVFFKLAKGRGDLFVQNSQVSLYAIKRLKLEDQIVEIPNVLDSTPFNLCIGKKSSYVKILPEFDETLRKMKKSGKLQEIYDKYK